MYVALKLISLSDTWVLTWCLKLLTFFQKWIFSADVVDSFQGEFDKPKNVTPLSPQPKS